MTLSDWLNTPIHDAARAFEWHHLDGTLCVAGFDGDTGLCIEGGGPVTPRIPRPERPTSAGSECVYCGHRKDAHGVPGAHNSGRGCAWCDCPNFDQRGIDQRPTFRKEPL